VTLAPEIVDRLWAFADALKVAPASEKLTAFETLCRRAAGLICAEFPQPEAVDRLQSWAEVNGLVQTYGDDQIQEVLARALADPLSEGDEIDDSARPPAFSDEALALSYAEQHDRQLRYVAAWGRWQLWNDIRWRSDDTLHAFDMVRRICREAAQSCNKPKVSTSIASAKTVAAVERLARSDRRLAATTDQWDTDAELINTPKGIVDLRTGENYGHSPNAYMTKVTAVAPDHTMATPIWLRFLERTTGGDQALADFLQRVSGYALTGLTSEHAMFFIYGTGANGKSTFLNALIGCFGDYHRTSAIETFTASATERHPTDLAALRGARLVTAVETEEGRRWAESKIKSLTGGDRIAARFMRQDFFEFTPAFKLIIAGNHKPGLRSVDEAIRRRLHLIPFTVTVPTAERDETLPDQLKAEWSGILAWAIRGCLEWQRIGLSQPECVRAATAAYLEGEDALAAWIDDECQSDPNAWESSTTLFYSWKRYADRSGEHHGSLKKFRQRLEDRSEALGLRPGRNGDGRRGFYGLRVAKAVDLASGADEASS
jgi:putative DNA primase/helicase